MRPICIEFQAFGPYPDYEMVNFDDLASRGLFLICGETGSGKTMILDAMTFALFGKSSTNARDDFAALRCTAAEFDKPTFVKFVFEAEGRLYSFERRLERKRKNLAESFGLLVSDDKVTWEPLFENPKKKDLDSKAAEIIGLDYDQFRQVIVLPQGQFERLLTSGSEEKEKILMNIFGEYKWEKIAQYVYDEAMLRQSRLKSEKDSISIRLKEDNCESIDELERYCEELKVRLAELDKEYSCAGLKETIASYRELEALFSDAAMRKSDMLQRSRNVELCAEKITKKQHSFETATAELKSHLDKKIQIEESTKTLVLYESKIGNYEEVSAVEKEVLQKRNELKKAEEAEVAAAKNCKQLIEKAGAAKTDYEKAYREYNECFDLYLKSVAGELAKDLTEGKPCPVCGSTVHPAKAVPAKDSVSKDEVESRKEKMSVLHDSLNEYEELRNKSVTQLEEAKRATLVSKNEYEKEEARLSNLKEGFFEGINSLDELKRTIANSRSDIERFNQKQKQYEENANMAQIELTKAKADLENAKTELADSEKKLKKSKEKAALEMEKCGYDFPKEELGKRLEDVEEAANRYNESRAVLKSNIDRIENKLADIRSKAKDLEPKLMEADADVLFAKKLKGDTGIGLQRYVLGIMFSSVIAAANRMLEMVHSGRYRLFRSDEKVQGSNKRGLELKVYDKFAGTGEGRFVNTLSGGEKFLASLALSIGMSTVAQRGGMRIEALFIDEGFGSLDENSIDDAMNILAGIQQSNGMVGIISHVQLLQDRIPSKIVVSKTKSRSSISTVIG